MDNYEKTIKAAEAIFLNYDQHDMIVRFWLASDREFIYVPLLDRNFRIDRKTGRCERYNEQSAEYGPADFEEILTVYDILCFSKPDAKPAGEYLLQQNLQSADISSKYVGEGQQAQTERFLDKKTESLSAACEKLGGVKTEGGDIAYRIPVFLKLSVILRFWNSDEDFPASLQFLCDKNMLDFMHYETVCYLTGHITRRILKMMSET